MVLLIRESDIAKMEFTPGEVIEAVENAYRQDGIGKAHETPRLEIKIKGRHLPHIAPGTTSVGQGLAYLEESNLFVISHSYHFDFHKYISQILDPETGETLAIVKRSRGALGSKPKNVDSGGFRTGAAAAIGAKYLSKKDIESVGIIGTGRIGRASLLCIAEVRDFDRVYSYSGRRRDEEFVNIMDRMVGADVIACDSSEEVVRRSELLVTATYAMEPVVKGVWLNEGTHISGMGADGPMKIELDVETFGRASKVIVDSEKCLSIKEMADALKSGVLKRNTISKIGQVVAGLIPGRTDDSEITIFESDGTIIQSAAVVQLIYEKALEMHLGVETKEVYSFFMNP